MELTFELIHTVEGSVLYGTLSEGSKVLGCCEVMRGSTADVNVRHKQRIIDMSAMFQRGNPALVANTNPVVKDFR